MRLDPAWKSTKWETEATTIKLQSPCFPTLCYSTFLAAAAAAAKSLQSCLTLCNPIDGSPPGSPVWDSPGKNTSLMHESEK